jgi:DNA replication protein DnaC
MVDQLDPPTTRGTGGEPDPDAIASDLERAGVPLRFRTRTLDAFVEVPGSEEGLAAVRRLVGDPTSLLLFGPSGTGKTHLAVGMLHELARTGRLYDRVYGRLHARFATVPELLDELRESVRYPQGDDPLRPLFTVPLLVLDDLGTEKPTEWVVDRLYVLINHRYGAELPTLVTTNYRPAQLNERGYRRMVSRLMEDAGAVEITTSTDYRLR